MNLADRIFLLEKLASYLEQEDNLELNHIKQTAFERNRWFTPGFIDLAIKNILEQYLAQDKLKAWVDHYRLDDNIKPRTVGVVTAGNIPLVGFHDFLSVFITGHKLHLKLSEKDETL